MMKSDIEEKVELVTDLDLVSSEMSHTIKIDIGRFHELICIVALVFVLLSKESQYMEVVKEMSSVITHYSTLVTFALKKLKQIQFPRFQNQSIKVSVLMEFV